VAGLGAMAENRRRAVLLVLEGDEVDHSVFLPAAARSYLAALGVPLVVWRLGNATAASAAWGASRDVRTATALRIAIDDLRAELAGQRIAMVDGRHLPQRVELGAAALAAGVRRLTGPLTVGPPPTAARP
jgi:hypothetical protein